MSTKSWVITIIPLAAFVLGFIYKMVSGTELTEQEMDLLKHMLYGFLGAGAIGGGKAAIESLHK